MSVSTSTALNTTEASVATTLTAAQAGTFGGMTIVQGSNPNGTDFVYTLRKNGVSEAITCSVTANNATTCSDTTHTVSYIAGDTIDVQVQRVGSNNLTGTFRVQLTAGAADAALNATGGTGGIIIDNTVTGGGSQVYYSTRGTAGVGNAVQASQAGLN